MLSFGTPRPFLRLVSHFPPNRPCTCICNSHTHIPLFTGRDPSLSVPYGGYLRNYRHQEDYHSRIKSVLKRVVKRARAYVAVFDAGATRNTNSGSYQSGFTTPITELHDSVDGGSCTKGGQESPSFPCPSEPPEPSSRGTTPHPSPWRDVGLFQMVVDQQRSLKGR